MQLSEMKTALRRYGFDEEDPLVTWLNAAMREFETANNWRFLLKEDVVAVVSGYIDFTDHTKILSVQYFNEDGTQSPPLQYLNYRRFIELQYSDPNYITDTSSTPKYYTLFPNDADESSNQKLVIWPQSTVTAARVVYLKQCEEMTESENICPLPEIWHYTIVRGAAAIGLEAESEEDRAAVAWARFWDAINRAIARDYPDTIDRNQQVIDSQGYGS